MRIKSLLIITILTSLLLILIYSPAPNSPRLDLPTPSTSPTITPSPTITSTPPIPTLTFSQLNTLYGPCVYLPVLTYHHIEDNIQAKEAGRTYLAVSPTQFDSHLKYLQTRGYSPVNINQLNNYFDHQTPLPTKPIMLTFDDGYEDFHTNAFPILRNFQYPSVMFLPTGLVNNPGYLNWSQITTMAQSGIVYFGNHTWSHQQLNTDSDTITREISTANTQLIESGLDQSKVFAHPFGVVSSNSQNQLSLLGYTLAFTTRPGSTLCAKQRLQLPRLRAGNFPLSLLEL